MNRWILGGSTSIVMATAAFATEFVAGNTSTFVSYNDVTESCVRTTPIPSGNYDSGDLEDEEALCEIDLYDNDIAICPKIWSTSAAIQIYDISEGVFKDNRLGFQTEICAGGKIAKYIAHDKLARLKFTMNQIDTSGTYTPSSLVYYHMSRYFDFTTTVPVAVWRSIDKSVLLNEVAIGGQALSALRADLQMNHAAWTTLVEAIQNPESYEKPGSVGTAADFLTSDGLSAYGTLYDDSGTLYGPEMNGAALGETREAGYTALLQTPVVLALQADLPLSEAIAEGLQKSGNTFTPADRETQSITPVQMAFWMREMAEILMIDTILGQQDRPGNIEYREYYYWQEDGKIERERVRDQVPGDDGIPLDAQILLRSRLNDNDAAARTEYDNQFAVQKAIENLRHFNTDLYDRLQAMNADFLAQGPIYQWLHNSVGLEDSQIEMIIANTAYVASVLKLNYDQGRLRLDLDPEAFFLAETAGQ